MAIKLILTFIGLFIVGFFVLKAATLPIKESAEYLFYGMPGFIIMIFAWFPWKSSNETNQS